MLLPDSLNDSLERTSDLPGGLQHLVAGRESGLANQILGVPGKHVKRVGGSSLSLGRARREAERAGLLKL